MHSWTMASNPCTTRSGKSKVRWATPDAAWYIAMDAQERGVLLMVYECPTCKGYHVSEARNKFQERASSRGVAALRAKLGMTK